ncbi:MAG: hypothetical protein GWN58_19410, partial [Anaerolineae bacterium]|nr:hypothetical protein [Anaerolineae bacterium]
EEGYSDANAFLQEEALAGRGDGKLGKLVDVKSDYFVVTSQVQFGRITVNYQSMIQRSATGEARVLMRAQGSL